MSDDHETPEQAKARRAAERQRRKERKQRREFPETMEVLARVRQAMVDQLFKTTMDARAERENLYRSVQILDAMTAQMEIVLNSGSEAIEAFIKEISAGGADGE